MEAKKENKKNIPRGASATKAKNKYRDKNYDRMELAFPIGIKQKIEEVAKKHGISKNAYILEAVDEKYFKEMGASIKSIEERG